MIAGDSLGELIATLGSIDDDEIDWQNVRQTTVIIHQSFRYDYAGPITALRQRLIVVPPDYHGHQRLVTHKLRVTGCDLDIERSYDSFGNVVLDLSLEEVERSVEFQTWAVVECDLPLDGRNAADEVAFDRRFGEPSRLTRPDDALREIAEQALASGATGLELAARICTLVHDHFTYAWGHTTVATGAAEAWASARGVCQDYAHCMVAICRLAGVHARYVSGHLLGEGGTHAWVEVLTDEGDGVLRATAFDPTHDRRTGPRYVTVAVGRDYSDVAPTSGTYEGPFAGELTTHKRAAVTRVEYLQHQPRRRIVTR